jgi:4-alpha-glucanotransferase
MAREIVMSKRTSGILMHVTSLPSSFGIGDLGPGAYRFADFLELSGQRLWQVLPLTPTDPIQGNSPYSSPSTFAGNPLIISPELMVDEGFLESRDIDRPAPEDGAPVDYAGVIEFKRDILDRAYDRFSGREERREFEGFRYKNSHWLEDFALFMVLKEHFKGLVWSDWPAEVRDRKPDTLAAFRKQLAGEIDKQRFFQFLFFKQWHALKAYCNAKGIRMVGDIPIYVSYDGTDAWADSEIFKLDASKKPTHVAGVPPDYFSSTGQLWGNPVYSWDVCKSTNFKWWLRRMEHVLSLYDIVRIDHFRGLVAYWEVPAGSENAVNGAWIDVPSKAFFDTMVKRFPDFPIIAEDLGVITPDVRDVMDDYKFPGMKVLLFAFGADDPDHPYLPHNYEPDFVVYTGTHDNNTARGWFENVATAEERARLARYVGRDIDRNNVHWELVRLAMASVADTAITPMQDVLGLGQEARMNLPGVLQGHWQWRMSGKGLEPALAMALRELTRTYGRA